MSEPDERPHPANLLESSPADGVGALANLEIPIVITALVGITDDLGGFQRASWIVAAYLLGYVGA